MGVSPSKLESDFKFCAKRRHYKDCGARQDYCDSSPGRLDPGDVTAFPALVIAALHSGFPI